MAVVLLCRFDEGSAATRQLLLDRAALLAARGEGHLVFAGTDRAAGQGMVAVRIHRDGAAPQMAEFLSLMRPGGPEITITRIDLADDDALAAASALFP
jgi:hypothetical protein